MRRVIEGKLYDTETARLLATKIDIFDSIVPRVQLYVTESQTYFLATSFRIEVISFDEAREWLDEEAEIEDVDACVKIFGLESG